MTNSEIKALCKKHGIVPTTRVFALAQDVEHVTAKKCAGTYEGQENEPVFSGRVN